MTRYSSILSIFRLLPFIALLMADAACRRTEVPALNVADAAEEAVITPDYTSLIIPPNIAPLNFRIEMPGEEYIARASAGEMSITAAGNPVRWNADDWTELLSAARGGEVEYQIFVRNGNQWCRYRFSNNVAEEEIDPWLSYRLIEPSYSQYGGMKLCMRQLTSFQERIFHNNAEPVEESRGQCMNCHLPRARYADKASQFHIRGYNGGTILMAGDSILKINLNAPGSISAGVYPAWNPKFDFIAYSTNDTHQKFFDEGKAKVEVYDNASDIILYDIKTGTIANIAADPELLETYPAWSPDGLTLCYSCAPYPEGTDRNNLADNYDKVRYDILRRRMDPASRTFTEPDTMVLASAAGRSALLPRISPDGRFLLYSVAPFGSFHIWHPESDLWMKDLSSGRVYPLENANSPMADSYHSWSSNSRWIVFSSRRGDGNYTRPYIAYISPEGVDSKAFVIPMDDPADDSRLMKSYNVPEFFIDCPSISRYAILKAAEAPQRNASWR